MSSKVLNETDENKEAIPVAEDIADSISNNDNVDISGESQADDVETSLTTDETSFNPGQYYINLIDKVVKRKISSIEYKKNTESESFITVLRCKGDVFLGDDLSLDDTDSLIQYLEKLANIDTFGDYTNIHKQYNDIDFSITERDLRISVRYCVSFDKKRFRHTESIGMFFRHSQKGINQFLVPENINDIVEYNENDTNIPTMLENSFKSLEKCYSGVLKAREKQEDAQIYSEKSLFIAKEAHKKVEEAAAKSAKAGKRKIAIEELQDAAIALADASEQSADVQQYIAEAQLSLNEVQRQTIEYQYKLSQLTKGLMNIGMVSIASNRAIVKELELKVQGASEQEIGQLARNELISVVKQLKEQQDVLIRLDKAEKNILINSDKINSISSELMKSSKRTTGLNDPTVDQVERVNRSETGQNSNNKYNAPITICSVAALIVSLISLLLQFLR